MELKISNIDEKVVVQFIGPVDFETPEQFYKNIKTLLPALPLNKFILDMNTLDFVGSSGIESFMIIIERLFGKEAKCVGLKDEFKLCFRVFSKNKNSFRLYNNVIEASLDDFSNINSNSKNNVKNTFSC